MTALSREALIEAAAAEVVTRAIMMAGAEISASDLVEFALDAVLPLIADAIEAKRAEHFAGYGNEETGPRNYDWALTHAADLVRSLSGGQPNA